MAIIKQYHKDTDTTYVYESTSYWDSEKGQSRSTRKVIGKIDPATGEIVPTGKRGRKAAKPAAATSTRVQEVKTEIMAPEEEKKTLELQVRELKVKIAQLEEKNQKLQNIISKSDAMMAACRSLYGEVLKN